MPKLDWANMAPILLHTMDQRRSITPLTMWSIKHCVIGSKKKYMPNWPIVPNTWLVKIGTNLSEHE